MICYVNTCDPDNTADPKLTLEGFITKCDIVGGQKGRPFKIKIGGEIVMFGGTETPLYIFNAIDMETGMEFVRDRSILNDMPRWVFDPMLRSMKLAEWRQQQRRKKK